MKKLIPFAAAALLLQGCANLPYNLTPEAEPSPGLGASMYGPGLPRDIMNGALLIQHIPQTPPPMSPMSP